MDSRTATIYFLARRLGAWLLAVAAAYLIASITATQAVVVELGHMGVDVPPGERALMTGKDILGMASTLLPMIAFALLVAFMAAALCCRWLERWQVAVYALAGASGLITIHLTLNLALGLTPVAIARSVGGLMLQGLAGGIGGFTYILLIRRQPALGD